MHKYAKDISGGLFSDHEIRPHRWSIFKLSELGKIYDSIPFNDLVNLLPSKQEESAGAPAWFDRAGMFALMFLKPYLGLSDEKLIARINTDWSLQLFCGVQFNDNQQIRDRNLPSRIRSYFGKHLNIEEFQELMVKNWLPSMDNLNSGFSDATVYESYIKYPTDVKLLWDCCLWTFKSLFSLCKELGIKRPRSKYVEQERKQLAFQKKKKKPYKIRQKRRKALLHLLRKGIGQLENIIEEYRSDIEITSYLSILEKLETVSTVLEQQQYMHDNQGEYVKNRIVSLFKPYLRPIVRGKENKRVEFGSKVHVHQVDGINIIDKLSFDPFNEAKQLIGCVNKHEQLFGELHELGVDNIYGTNENRKFLTNKNVQTCLPRKGRAGKQENQSKKQREEIGRKRATVLEGSFGNEKNNYSLRKIKARTEATEVIWIIFGIMTANAVKISKRETVKGAA